MDVLKQKETDIDEYYNISAIKEIVYDNEDQVFYVLCNKYSEKLGFFVLKMSESNPKEANFLIKWKNKLDIGDTNFYILRDKVKGIKEIIVSFKTIYINTYNVMIMDISNEKEQFSLIFRHESFQLWESEINGFLTNRNHDFVTINRDGINILALGSIEKRKLRDGQGNERMIHSLEAMNFLKVDPSNYLLFASAKMEKREV